MPSRATTRTGGRLTRQPFPALVALAMIVTAWLVSNAVLGDFIAPSPLAVGTDLGELVTGADFYHNLGATVLGCLLALVIGSAFGVLVGVLAGANRSVRTAVTPLLTLGNSTPLLAVIPILIVWFGFGLTSVVAGAVMLAVFPIGISTLSAIEGMDRSLTEVADAFGAPPALRTTAVVVPGVLPAVLTGVRVGFGRVFIGVVAGEMLFGQAGLGWSARRVGDSLDMAAVVAHVVVLAVFALLVFKLFDVGVRVAWPWLPAGVGAARPRRRPKLRRYADQETSQTAEAAAGQDLARTAAGPSQ